MDTSPSDRPNDNDIVLKQSDFSIDHILNKAGVKDTYNFCIADFSVHNKVGGQYGAQSNHNVCNTFVPMLNWLQYTRYRPPKLPSKYPVRHKRPRALKYCCAVCNCLRNFDI